MSNYMEWYNKGISYYNAKNFEKAIACYENAISMDRKSVKLWYSMGLAYRKLKLNFSLALSLKNEILIIFKNKSGKYGSYKKII